MVNISFFYGHLETKKAVFTIRKFTQYEKYICTRKSTVA